MNIETILSPLELSALGQHPLRETVCVVFDVLRATSTFVTALHHGAKAIIPVGEVTEAIGARQRQPAVLLAGERAGIKIRAAQADGIDFDFGNSPREFTSERVRDKIIVSTTTNGTRALRTCANASLILASSFLNLSATAKFLTQLQPKTLLLVCAGTGNDVALEDVLAAGALADLLTDDLADSTEIARRTFLRSKLDLSAAIASSRNGRRLLGIPELRADVPFCSQRDIFNLVAAMDANGCLRKVL